MHGSINIKKKSTGIFGKIIAVLSEHRNKTLVPIIIIIIIIIII
jgi:hypothetical protein